MAKLKDNEILDRVSELLTSEHGYLFSRVRALHTHNMGGDPYLFFYLNPDSANGKFGCFYLKLSASCKDSDVETLRVIMSYDVSNPDYKFGFDTDMPAEFENEQELTKIALGIVSDCIMPFLNFVRNENHATTMFLHSAWYECFVKLQSQSADWQRPNRMASATKGGILVSVAMGIQKAHVLHLNCLTDYERHELTVVVSTLYDKANWVSNITVPMPYWKDVENESAKKVGEFVAEIITEIQTVWGWLS